MTIGLCFKCHRLLRRYLILLSIMFLWCALIQNILGSQLLLISLRIIVHNLNTVKKNSPCNANRIMKYNFLRESTQMECEKQSQTAMTLIS